MSQLALWMSIFISSTTTRAVTQHNGPVTCDRAVPAPPLAPVCISAGADGIQRPTHSLQASCAAVSPARSWVQLSVACHGSQLHATAVPQMTIRQKEAEQVAPYSASFQRTMISSVLKADDGGVSQVLLRWLLH